MYGELKPCIVSPTCHQPSPSARYRGELQNERADITSDSAASDSAASKNFNNTRVSWQRLQHTLCDEFCLHSVENGMQLKLSLTHAPEACPLRPEALAFRTDPVELKLCHGSSRVRERLVYLVREAGDSS
jgi:hypothetical protein